MSPSFHAKFFGTKQQYKTNGIVQLRFLKALVHCSLQKCVPCFCNRGPLVEWANIVQFAMHMKGICRTTSNWCMNTSHQCLWKPRNNWYFQCWDQIVTPPFPFAMMNFGPFVGYYKGTINKSIWNGWWTTIWISLHILHILWMVKIYGIIRVKSTQQ